LTKLSLPKKSVPFIRQRQIVQDLIDELLPPIRCQAIGCEQPPEALPLPRFPLPKPSPFPRVDPTPPVLPDPPPPPPPAPPAPPPTDTPILPTDPHGLCVTSMSVQGAVSWVFDTATALNLANQGDTQLQDELVDQCANATIFDEVTSECLQNVNTVSIGAPITLALNNMSCDELADYLKLEYSIDNYPEPNMSIDEILLTYGFGDCQSSNYDLSCATTLADLTDNLTEQNLVFNDPAYVKADNKRGWVYGDASDMPKAITKAIVPTEAALGIATTTVGDLIDSNNYIGVKGLAQSFSSMLIQSIKNIQSPDGVIIPNIGLDFSALYDVALPVNITSLSLNMTGSITVDIPGSILKRKDIKIRVAQIGTKNIYVQTRQNLVDETLTTNFTVNNVYNKPSGGVTSMTVQPISVGTSRRNKIRLNNITLTIIPNIS